MEYSKDPATNAIPNGASQWNTPEAMAIAFAEKKKAQIAARAIFELVHQYGDNLREGWKNVLDFLLYLLRANLLPSQMTEMEDFVDPRGHVPLKERFKRTQLAPKKEESGLFSWLGFSSSSAYGESDQYKRQTEEEKELCKKALNIILECHPEQLVPDSKYLASSALTELINNIIQCSLSMVPIPVSPTPVQQQETHHQQEECNSQTQQKHQRHQHESQGSSHSQDDDSIVDLSLAAALLPAEQRQNGQTNLQQLQEQQQHAQLGHIESHLSAGSIGSSSTSIIQQQQHINQPPPPTAHHQQQHHYVPAKLSIDVEEAMVFLLELIVNIVLENRDRLAQVWSLVREHLHWLFTNFQQNQQLIDRSVVAILRIANRNLFRLGQQLQPMASPLPVTREKTTTPSASMTKSVVIVVEDEQHQQPKMPKEVDQIEQTIQQRTSYCADEVLQFMGRQLLALRPPEMFLFSRQIAFGIQNLLRANAANVHSAEHWEMFFIILEAVGAAAYQEDEYDLPKWPANPQQKEQQKSNIRDSVQSEPEEIAATPNQPRIDDRGYCSDDPSLLLERPTGNVGGSGSNAEERKRRMENPLLTAAMEHRGQIRLLNKGDSGEWIHVVSATAPAAEQQQQQQSMPTNAAGIAEHLQQIQEEQIKMEETESLIENTEASAQSMPHTEPLLPLPPTSIQYQDQQKLTEEVGSDNVQQQPPSQQMAEEVSIPTQVPIAPQAPAPPPPPPHPRANVFKRGTIVLAPNLSRHDPAAFLKVVEILTFLARDAAHITPANFTQFTHCLRMMVEASMDGGKCAPLQLPSSTISTDSPIHAIGSNHNQQSSVSSKQFMVPHPNEKGKEKQQQVNKQQTQEMVLAPVDGAAEDEKISEQERLANCYMNASLQLLNICVQLHARAANIYRDWSEASAAGETEKATSRVPSAAGNGNNTELFANYWRPLLQAIARMSCDCRRRIRAIALDTLGAAFRAPSLGELMEPSDWENCFAEVLFPLLTRLLTGSPPISPMDPIGMEEARIRGIQLTCKILLSHLTQISRLETFADLLRRLFDLMDQFLEGNACSDLLAEVIQESLKNCVLVCENFGIFQGPMAGLQVEMNERLEGLAKKHSYGLKMAL